MQDLILKDQCGGLTLSNLTDLPNQGSRVLTTERTKTKKTSCARGDTICPRPLYAGRCGPDAAAQL